MIMLRVAIAGNFRYDYGARRSLRAAPVRVYSVFRAHFTQGLSALAHQHVRRLGLPSAFTPGDFHVPMSINAPREFCA